MKVAITGHTQGIGLEIYNYFKNQGHEVVGFSKSTGYDISDSDTRVRILKSTRDFDIFVNNAWTAQNNGQFQLLETFKNEWKFSNKIIVNLGSRASDFVDDPKFPWPDYARLKKQQDLLCQSDHGTLWIINLKPGKVNTRMGLGPGPKLEVSAVTKILDFALNNRDSFSIKSITFTI